MTSNFSSASSKSIKNTEIKEIFSKTMLPERKKLGKKGAGSTEEKNRGIEHSEFFS